MAHLGSTSDLKNLHGASNYVLYCILTDAAYEDWWDLSQCNRVGGHAPLNGH